MNYLAHFHLAQWDDDWIIGALLGDFVKGPLPASLPAKLRQGIQLHRRIDAFSDSHPLRAQFAKNLSPGYRRYAGILLDVCCDYWLSRHWSSFEAVPIADFSARIYAVLSSGIAQMPTPAAHMTQRLVEYDVLAKYNDTTVIAATLERIGARLRRDNPLRYPQDLAQHLASAEQIFLQLYPQLVTYVTAHTAAVSVE